MRQCERLEEYLDGVLDNVQAGLFEDHLDGCEPCAEAVNRWRAIEASLREDVGEDDHLKHPTHEEAAALVWKARELETGRSAPPLKWALVAAGVVLVVSAAFAGGFLLKDSPQEPSPYSKAPLLSHGDNLTWVPPDLTGFEIEGAQVAVEPGSTVGYRTDRGKTVVRIETGLAAFAVAPRGENERFTVEAGDVTVSVIGTVFSVALEEGEGVRVSVTRGKVRAEVGAEAEMVSQGETVVISKGEHRKEALAALDRELLGGLLGGDNDFARTGKEEFLSAQDGPAVTASGHGGGEPSKTGHQKREPTEVDPEESTSGGSPQPQSMEGRSLWREWILEGKLDEARNALRGHLTENPSDPEGWSLLGDCERKRGSWMDALAAYSRLASLSPGEPANRARFKAAVILQDKLHDHRGAAAALEEMLKHGTGVEILEARAKVRLASSYSALGRLPEARRILREVVERFPGSSPARQAKQMLEGMKGP